MARSKSKKARRTVTAGEINNILKNMGKRVKVLQKVFGSMDPKRAFRMPKGKSWEPVRSSKGTIIVTNDEC